MNKESTIRPTFQTEFSGSSVETAREIGSKEKNDNKVTKSFL